MWRGDVITELVSTARQVDPSNLAVYDVAKDYSVAVGDWSSAAGAVAERAQAERITGVLSQDAIGEYRWELRELSRRTRNLGAYGAEMYHRAILRLWRRV